MKIHLCWCLFLLFGRMLVSRFASRFRKDSSTEMVRTNLAHRKSLSQKENRHRVYERNRHFGLKDVNIPLEGRELGNIHETSQDLSPEKASSKTSKEGSFVSVSTFETQGVWRDGSAVESVHCSCRGPGVSS